MPKVKDLTTNAAPALTDYTVNERIGGPGTQPNKTTWQKVFDLFVANGMQADTSESGIISLGANQAGATILTKKKNRVDTTAPGTGVVEDVVATPGKSRTVQNNGVNDLLWYPKGANQFFQVGVGLLGASTPITVAPGNQASYFCYDNGELTII